MSSKCQPPSMHRERKERERGRDRDPLRETHFHYKTKFCGTHTHTEGNLRVSVVDATTVSLFELSVKVICQ